MEQDLATIQDTIASTVAAVKEANPDATIRLSDTATSPLITLPLLSLPPLPLESNEEALPSLQTPQWELRSKLGAGGMGTVFELVQRSLGRSTAVKLMSERAPSPLQTQELLREARLTGRLEHPNILPVHLLGLDANGNPALVMKRVEGLNLRALLRAPTHPLWKGRSEVPAEFLAAKLELLVQVCNAVHFANDHGVLHRDIKTENIMVGTHGEVYLLDWGIALEYLTSTDHVRRVVGTPSYMAPEMVEGLWSALTPQTDVYLLGATLHEMLTGTPRHRGENLQQMLLTAYLSEPFAYGPEVPEELARLCNDACAKRPEDRPASVEAFRARLTAFLEHRPSVALCAAAQRSLAQLSTLMGEGPSADAASEQERFAIEARFGFLQALRVWPGNPEALHGYQRLLEVLVEREIQRRNLSAARSLLAELDAPTPALTERVEALARALEESQLQEEQLRQEARELDPSIARRERSYFVLILLAVAVVVSGYFALRGGGSSATPTPKEILSAEVLLDVLILFVGWKLRAQLFANRFGRRYVQLGLAALGFMSAIDAVGFFAGFPVEASTPAKLLCVGWILAVAGWLTRPLWLWASSCCLLAGTLGALFPRALNVLMFVTMTGTLTVIYLVDRRTSEPSVRGAKLTEAK